MKGVPIMVWKNYFMKQIMMRRVIYSLVPIILASIYFFGLRALMLQIVVLAFAIGTEYIFEKKNKKKISEAVIVTSILYTLTLPPATPYWIAVVGIVFGVVFAKEVFGGFGKNVFNPALVARAFIYVCFPEQLTIEWAIPSLNFPGGFIKYINPMIETISTATPLSNFRTTGELIELKNLIFGFIPGSLGETSKLLIILAAIYLIKTKTASWQIMLSMLLGFFATSYGMIALGFDNIINPIYGVLSGGFLFALVFMATDPISSASTKEGKYIYGALIGIVTVIIRGFALFAGGVMFSILIVNTFTPLIDELIKMNKASSKAKQGVA